MTVLAAFLVYGIALSAALAWKGHRSRQAPSANAPSFRPPAEGAARGRPERVLIVGATGGTGRRLVAQALERGHSVTAFVRDPSKLRVDHPRLTVAQGDVLDYPSLEAAMRDQDAVLCALGHKRYFGPTRILSEGTRNLLRAMDSQAVARLVCETSLGIGDSAGRMGLYYTLFVIPVILPFYYWDKTRQERIIAASPAEWVIVRPAVLTNRERRGSLRHGSGVGSFLWTRRISRADAADFMLDQLTSDQYLRAAPGVSG